MAGHRMPPRGGTILPTDPRLEARQHTKGCWWNWFEANWQCANDCPTRREPGLEVDERSASPVKEKGRSAASSPSLDIQVLPEEANEDTDTMRHLADLINRVYAGAEKGQWRPGATRTSAEEITELTRAGQMVVARVDGAVVGAIRVRHLDSRTGETGMLAVDPEYRNLGIARELRWFVAQLLRSQGITTLQIELLVPRDWEQSSKTFMADWNSRTGYKVVQRGAFEEHYPDLAPQLATPCDFIINHKEL
ncbi:GNAT family N-acetyltransferase [Actinoallomurus sp. CA-150999]|uniref:GNAT family N-acetyltransferase n=1 Tax=Actinoallomurus sp. CA-150999 TaxID=3239887 RepID=UPI003D90AC1E